MNFDQKETRQSELNNCVFCKTILMLLVVMGHAIVFWRGSWYTGNPICSAKIFPFLSNWIGSFHTYSFVGFSGYIFYYMKYERGEYQTFRFFLKNKAKRLLIPYVFTSCVWIIPIMVCYLQYTTGEIFWQFIVGISPSQLWFLLMLFWVFVISWLLSDILVNTKWGSVILAILYAGGVFGSHICPNFLQIWKACRYLPYFWVGMKLRCGYSKSVRKISGIIWVLLYTLMVYAEKFVDTSSIAGKCMNELLLLLSHVFGVIMAYCVLQKAASFIPWEKSEWFRLMSRYSMPIYLFHQQIIYFLIDAFNGKMNPYIHATINFAGAIIGSFLLSFLLMKFRITRFLIGEKQ